MPGGRVELTWVHEPNGRLVLRWEEIDGPTVQKPTRRGFGGRIIEQMISQLKGNTSLDWRPQGLLCEIAFQT